MKTQVNYKAVLILLAGALVFGTGVHFLHAFQVQRNARGLSEYAAAMEKDGDKAQAIKLLEKYAGMMPLDGDALARLGLLLEEQANTGLKLRRAYLVLEQALQRNDSRA